MSEPPLVTDDPTLLKVRVGHEAAFVLPSMICDEAVAPSFRPILLYHVEMDAEPLRF